jgi:glutathione synthase/RimK-type ligase-like ATP-grasp enzyme
MPESTSPAEWEAVLAQWRTLCEGLVSVPGPTWISSPFSIATAENKALQLSRATALGFRVPHTLWTNSRSDAERFLSELGGKAVCKTVATARWRADDTAFFVFALSLTAEDLPAPDGLSRSPLTFQEIVAPKQDVRVTVVGRRTLAAVRQSTNDDDPIDWRLGEDAKWLTHELPEHTSKACVALAREMSVRFAGIDLVLDDNGNYWFIELNPNGEWRWLQAAGLPVVEAIADELIACK